MRGQGAWTAYSSPFTITEQGRQVLEVRSVDKAGNIETAQSEELAVDTVQPEVLVASAVELA